jgi:hypothetical protein
LAHDSVAAAIIRIAADWAESQRPPRRSNVRQLSVYVSQDSDFVHAPITWKADNYNGVVDLRLSERYSRYYNRLRQDHRHAAILAQRRVQRQVEAQAAEAQKAAQDAAAAEERRQADDRLSQFKRKYGVQQMPDVHSLGANPFNYEGTVVGVRAAFGEMSTATTGLFNALPGNEVILLVSDIPRQTFKGREFLLLAGRVLGKAPIKTPLGEMSVPSLKFIGMERCANYTCAELLGK